MLEKMRRKDSVREKNWELKTKNINRIGSGPQRKGGEDAPPTMPLFTGKPSLERLVCKIVVVVVEIYHSICNSRISSGEEEKKS